MKNSRVVKFLASAKLLIALLVIIAAASVIGTFIPQGEPPEAYISRYGEKLYRILGGLSLFNLYSSFWFVALLVLLCLNIICCTLSKFSLKPKLLGTLIVHLSVIVILAGGTIGALFGEKGFMKISEGETLGTFYTRDERPVKLNFSLHLEDFKIDWYEPPHYAIFAQLADGSVRTLKFEKVEEEKSIEGAGLSIKLLHYVADFAMNMETKEVTSKTSQPNNPAAEILLKGRGQEARLWLFEKFPGFGQEEASVKFAFRRQQGRPKDYKSKLKVIDEGREVLEKTIEVNDPLTYKGYTFYQSTYDPEDLSWSGLQVKRDPAVPIAYAGFVFLIAGLTFIYFIKPYIRQR